MSIGERWQRWWDRLTHGEPEQARSGDGRGAQAAPESARRIGSMPTAPDGELKLSVDPGKGAIPQRGKVRSAGFDPYSNDAGYEKPRNWDEVDPR
jgi:hypothetical protein